MSLRRTEGLAFLLALAVPAGASAQGLGDAAARERAKRQAAKPPGPAKSFTNEDLEKGRPPGQAAAAGDASPAPVGEADAPVPEPSEPDRVTQEKPYMDAVMGARSALTAAEARVRELQDRLNPMSINFVFGAATSGDQTAEAARVREELQQAEAQLGQARQALAQANQALEDFRMGRTPQPPSDH